ncbi:metal ABC transporter substrate-binding protein [Ornithinimicrobium sp. F0845]|uniref:metal ABC transporter substrate-binding protein n=1 Tax=Ornithinimicrobium sp. F0845 TaxID=2926412 RepID=UPI001FF2F48E|nr:metal ABC transporter substrate-binding protein [Ornithinimicrobium sp. F0845]MCK0111165.1 metal ABC transporter substrate-binding protein [Ornithinimicrobium sp. F0845]
MTRPTLAVSGALATALLLTACGSDGASAGDDGRLSVVTGFYPLEYAAERVVGDVPGVTVETLTSPGTDAHDLELSPRQVGAVQDADLVIFSAGMQAAVDAAVAEQAPDRSLDVTSVVALAETGDDHEDHGDHDHEDHDGHDHEGHDHEGHDHDGHDHGPLDPHFWLDPERYAAAGAAIAEELAAIDPVNAEDYLANAEAFSQDLDELDAEFREGLASCEHDTMVTTHEAFGYLADRYGLHQVGITGITPEAEASPARMAEITREVEALAVPAIYAQSTLGGDLAEVIGRETGTQVLVLDPIEGLTDASAGNDYFQVMRANLEALRQGQVCS